MAGLISVMCCCRFVFWDNQQLKVLSGVNTEPLKSRVTKSKNFPDSKIFVAKTFRIKCVNHVNFQIRDKYA